MTCYADTSWWLSYKCRQDVNHRAACRLFARHAEAQVIWTPWQRVEVFNSFLQAERHGLIAPTEGMQVVRLLEHEVRLGYWPHRELQWTNAIRRAWKISAGHSLNMVVRGMDLFHVAVAQELKADAFVSFDGDQKALAAAVGLHVLAL